MGIPMATDPISLQQLRNASEDAQDLEHYINDDVPALIQTRLGGQKPNYVKFLADKDAEFQQFLLSSGYQDLGDYAAGVQITSRNQLFRRDGELYRAGATLDFPYTLTGDWATEGSNFVSVGDAALRQEIAQPSGSMMVGFQQSGSGAASRDAQDKMRERVTPQDYGADPTGIRDSTVELADFLAAVAGGKNGDIGTGNTYLFTQMSIPPGVRIRGQSTFRCAGNLTAGMAVTVLGDAQIETLHVSTPGTDSAFDIMHIAGDNVEIGDLVVESDIQRSGAGGILHSASGLWIKNFVTKNIARPYVAERDPLGTIQTEIHIQNVDIENYIRGIKLTNCEQWSVGSFRLRGRDSRAGVTAGHNGFLVQGCRHWTVGDGEISDSGEHAFRIGGSNLGNTTDFAVGRLLVKRSGGCGFKVNPDAGQLAQRGELAGVFGVDVGQGTVSGNAEVVRLTKYEDIRIGYIKAVAEQYSQSCTRALLANSGTNLYIDEIAAQNCAARIWEISQDSDGGTGNVFGVYINRVSGSVLSASAAFGIFFTAVGRAVGNIFVRNVDVSGFTNRILDATGANTNGPVYIAGRVYGAVAPSTNAPDSDNFLFDLQYGLNSAYGRATALSYNYRHETAAGSIDLGASPTGAYGNYFASGIQASPAAGSYGGAYAFSRLGSTRRGAAIAAKQITSTAHQVGLAFLVGSPASGSTDQIVERMTLKHNGVLNLNNLPAFADDSAAGAGGMVSGDFYRTSSGELRIKL